VSKNNARSSSPSTIASRRSLRAIHMIVGTLVFHFYLSRIPQKQQFFLLLSRIVD
jgi:hypothetical protein